MEETQSPRPKRQLRKHLVWGLCIVLAIAVLASGYLFWRAHRPIPLLPQQFRSQRYDFTPYFFFTHMPAGYSVDAGQSSYNGDILFVTLTKPGGASLVVSEQTLPGTLPPQLQGIDGERVSGTKGLATIMKLSGRSVGVLIANQKPETLILITGSSETPTDDLIGLLRGLQPIR